jgi:hypothetical protein
MHLLKVQRIVVLFQRDNLCSLKLSKKDMKAMFCHLNVAQWRTDFIQVCVSLEAYIKTR